jgi:hypothetical protein
MDSVLEAREKTVRFIVYLVRYLRDGTTRYDMILDRINIESQTIGRSKRDFLNPYDEKKYSDKGREKTRAMTWYEVARFNPEIRHYAHRRMRECLDRAGLKLLDIGLKEENLSSAT